MGIREMGKNGGEEEEEWDQCYILEEWDEDNDNWAAVGRFERQRCGSFPRAGRADAMPIPKKTVSISDTVEEIDLDKERKNSSDEANPSVEVHPYTLEDFARYPMPPETVASVRSAGTLR